HHRHGLHGGAPLDVLDVDHRVPLVRLALGARVLAGVAPDAPVRVHKELHLGGHRSPPCCGSSRRAYSGSSALRRRTAHTLYSGIFEIGSWAEMVTRLMLLAPAQWYGTNTVSGRIVVTTWHRTVSEPRRDSTVTQSPVAIPCLRARIGCSSSSGSGYWSTSGPIRRVWFPERNMFTVRPVVRMTG